jgi:hypothetical protein
MSEGNPGAAGAGMQRAPGIALPGARAVSKRPGGAVSSQANYPWTFMTLDSLEPATAMMPRNANHLNQ